MHDNYTISFEAEAERVTPTGKRSVRINVWGNIVGYVSGKRFCEFGSWTTWNEQEARAWLAETGEEANMKGQW